MFLTRRNDWVSGRWGQCHVDRGQSAKDDRKSEAGEHTRHRAEKVEGQVRGLSSPIEPRLCALDRCTGDARNEDDSAGQPRRLPSAPSMSKEHSDRKRRSHEEVLQPIIDRNADCVGERHDASKAGTRKKHRETDAGDNEY